MEKYNYETNDHEGESWFKKHQWITWGTVAVIAAYLFTEHTQHVLSALPWLLLAACPLMHFFHGGHGHHHGGGDSAGEHHHSGHNPDEK